MNTESLASLAIRIFLENLGLFLPMVLFGYLSFCSSRLRKTLGISLGIVFAGLTLIGPIVTGQKGVIISAMFQALGFALGANVRLFQRSKADNKPSQN